MSSHTNTAKPAHRVFTIVKGALNNRWFPPIFFLFVTVLYFFPMIIRIGTYIPGGDSMFNAWVMERNQNCILRQHCPVYTDANIYYPNKDTMLYSETEVSPSVVTMPIHLLNDNPIIAYNIITIASFFMAGWSMYLFARYLSKGNTFFSIAAGAVFEFTPMMLAATTHLPNLSIFCLPLAMLFIFKYLDTKRKKYLLGLFLALVYVFYASWYQMVFVLFCVGVLMVGLLAVKRSHFKSLCVVAVVIFAACLAILPLASQYLRFSHTNGAKYTIQEKIANSASALDFFIPPQHTIAGRVFHRIDKTAFGPETWSYAGLSLYIILAVAGLFLLRKKYRVSGDHTKIYLVFLGIALVGFVVALGPYLKIEGKYLYTVGDQGIGVPLPYFFVDKYIPVLGFMRGLARASILLIFALCCLLALLPAQLARYPWYKKRQVLVNVIIGLILFADFAPMTMVPLSANPHSFSPQIPPLYQLIKKDPKIDNIIILQAEDYPKVDFWFARTETVLWAGYHNKNIYNGYSGYVPPTYEAEYSDFVNLDADDPAQMRARGLKYVVVDTELYTNKPEVLKKVPDILGKPMYSDSRYQMYKL